MANERGQYGATRLGAGPSYQQGSSLGTVILGGLAIGGAVLWIRYQSAQIAALHKATGLPHQSFAASMREQARALPAAARSKLHALTRDPHAKKTEAL